MDLYIGTKTVLSKPMNLRDYSNLRGWEIPDDQDGDDEGYLVEYLDGGKPNLQGYEGYVSWSPKAQFENAYRRTTGLSFGLALEAAKMGKRIARTGWNGKGMWVAYTPGSTFPPGLAREGHAAKHRANESPTTDITLLPHLDMRAADGSMVIGWLASQTDMLADDWEILE